MKAFINVVSWISFFTIAIIVAVGSLAVSVFMVNRLAEVLGICGTWWALALVPVLFMAAWAICSCFILGVQKFKMD